MAQTFSSTSTFARLHFIKIQLKVALQKTTEIDSAALERHMEAVENRWIHSYSIYALDTSHLCRAELRLDIDWDEYDHQISVGRMTVVADRKLMDASGVTVEVDTMVEGFQHFVRDERLSTIWRVRYSESVEREGKYEEVSSYIQTRPATSLRWKGAPLSMQKSPVPDLKVGLRLT